MKRAITLTSVLGLLAMTACDAGGSGGPSNEPPPPDGQVPVALHEVVAGLSFPVYLTAPVGDPRLFILEKSGAIRVVKDGALLPTPFLDLSARVSGGAEQNFELGTKVNLDATRDLLEACRVVALAAAPFMPAAAQRAHGQLGLDYGYAANGADGPALAGQAAWGALGGGGQVGAQEILFPRVEIETATS